jgi:hypothetical protein
MNPLSPFERVVTISEDGSTDVDPAFELLRSLYASLTDD